MNPKKIFGMILVLGLLLPSIAMSQFREQGFSPRLIFESKIGIEHFNRTITWGEDGNTSPLEATIFTLEGTLSVEGGFALTGIFGYTLSSLDGLEFRKLPLSIELGVGKISGLVFGLGLERSLFELNEFEIIGTGQFVYNYGLSDTWDIPGLSVEGQVTGRPDWFRVFIGPEIRYHGLLPFNPFLRLCYNTLWGTFKMEQSILNMLSDEDIKINGKGKISVSLGALYELSDFVTLRGEVDLIPNSESIDLGVLFKVGMAF